HPRAQLRCAVRHDAHPPRSAESLRGAARARRARSHRHRLARSLRGTARLSMPALTVPPGALGIVAMHELPDPAWESRWTRIVVPDEVKERLLNITLFSLRHRARIDAVRLLVHGLIVLAGPPGTGKTT